jgi:hypothetical protein
MHLVGGKRLQATDRLVLPDGIEREPQTQVKLLGIILDNKLSFKPHVEERLQLSTGAFAQVWRMGGVFQGNERHSSETDLVGVGPLPIM